MNVKNVSLFIATAMIATNSFAQKGDPKLTEFYSPVPKVITSGKSVSDAPSDATILFDGKNLSEWVSTEDTTKEAAWTVAKKMLTVKKGTGNIQTKKSFTDYQLHIEWRIPANITGEGQGRGNSGVFLASTGKGDAGYEIQILDCYNQSTYVNGQTASIYKQSIPLVNVCKKPGEWQVYDIVYHRPRFKADGTLASAARLTVFHNGVLIQDNMELVGPTANKSRPPYTAHPDRLPITLQDHGHPVRFRNVWLRELEVRP